MKKIIETNEFAFCLFWTFSYISKYYVHLHLPKKNHRSWELSLLKIIQIMYLCPLSLSLSLSLTLLNSKKQTDTPWLLTANVKLHSHTLAHIRPKKRWQWSSQNHLITNCKWSFWHILNLMFTIFTSSLISQNWQEQLIDFR